MIKNLFKLDLRSLAMARIFLGVLVFFDIGRRIKDIDTFFTDSGILPRWTLLEQYELNWRMSILSLNGSYTFALLVALAGMLAAITFTLGWRTRISNAIIWITIISFQARFPEASTSGGDMLLRIFLLWSFFLPMSARYSVDRAVSGVEYKENEYFSIWSAIWIVQIMLLYIFTFFYKWSPVYHTSFEAVWFMLQLDIFTTSIGKWLGQFYNATKVLSFSSYALEIVGPLLLFIPFRRDLFRGIAVISFWCFHSGIGLTMHLGNFVPICLIIWVGLIPTAWWDYLAEKLKETSVSAMNLYYDGQSELARKMGMIGRELFFLDAVRVLPSNMHSRADGMMSETQSFVLEDEHNNLITGSAIFPQMLLSSKMFFFRFIGRLFLSKVGTFLSEVKEAGEVSLSDVGSTTPVPSLEKSMLKKTLETLFETLGFGKVKFHLNKFEKYFGTFILLLIIAWNFEGYIKERKWYIGSPFDEIMFTLHLQQGWAMFAPHPQRSDGWWVMDGNMKDGSKWDVMNNKDVSFDRPHDFYETFASDDWRKFLDNLQGSRDENHLRLLARHLCRTWNAKHTGDQALNTFKLYFMQEFTKGPKESPATVEKISLWSHSCF